MRTSAILLVMSAMQTATPAAAEKPRARQLGIEIGPLPTGQHNAITDVAGVTVGHRTVIAGEDVRTGVTVIVPQPGNLYQHKVPAAIHVGNGHGKLAGLSQVEELGTIETPIALTNTLAVPAAASALIRYTLALPGNETVFSVNPVVGETNDGRLNAIRTMPVTEQHVAEALAAAASGPVAQGAVGAGTGTVAFGYKGGIGSSSRVLPAGQGGFTVGVLVQSNYGGRLTIAGVPVEEALAATADPGGSCMIVVATDAPLDSRNLARLARRALLGFARTGSSMANASGDYVIAFSTGYRVPHQSGVTYPVPALVANEHMTPLFTAVADATEEALLDSLFAVEPVNGAQEAAPALPVERVLEVLRARGVIAP
jgi:D-aminopeptidase